MKPLLSLLAAVSVFGIAFPANAIPPPFISNAAVQPYPGERRIINYLTNGTPVYAVYQIVGYDAMGYPIYQWVTQPLNYGYVRPYYSYNHGYRNYGYGYRSYNYRPGYVRPTIVNPPYIHPHPNFGGHVGHISGPVIHGGGHMSHGGGGHFSHGGVGHVSHGGGGHVSHGGGGHVSHGGGGHVSHGGGGHMGHGGGGHHR